jgi:AcrR family transcriptional regulator
MTRQTASSPRVRPVLSRAVILDAAMASCRDSSEMLSLAQVGRRLGADPTALYRHYRNRDELLRDLGDEVYRESLETVGRDVWARPWREMLSDWWWCVRRTYLQSPGLALEVAPRFTGGPFERLSSTRMREVLQDLGLAPASAARHTRAVAETTLGFTVITARLLTLPVQLQLLDTEIGHRLYPEVQPQPSDDTLEAALDDEEQTFALAFETQLDGLAAAIAGAASTPTTDHLTKETA